MTFDPRNLTPGRYWILKDKKPVAVTDLYEWADFFEELPNRIVVNEVFGDIRVSTVFLGLDHSWFGGTPLLFETMIFGGKQDGYQDRYSTWDHALIGHAEAVLLIQPEYRRMLFKAWIVFAGFTVFAIAALLASK